MPAPTRSLLRKLAAVALGVAAVLPAASIATGSAAHAQGLPGDESWAPVPNDPALTEIGYSSDGGRTWLGHLVVAPGTRVRVQQVFLNWTNTTIEDASVRTTLPPGFTLVPGSTSECGFVGGDAESGNGILCTPADEAAVWTGPRLVLGPLYQPDDLTAPLDAYPAGYVEYEVVAPTVDGDYPQLAELTGTLDGEPLRVSSTSTLTVQSAGVPLVDPVVGGGVLGAVVVGAFVDHRRRAGRVAA